MNRQEQVLSKLSLEQVQEALNCLYHELEPQDQKLQLLPPQDWSVLAVLLHELMQ